MAPSFNDDDLGMMGFSVIIFIIVSDNGYPCATLYTDIALISQNASLVHIMVFSESE